MTDDLKERLRNPLGPEVDGYHHTYPWVIDLCKEAFTCITDLEARLAAAEAGEDALAAGLRALWFHDAPHSALAAYEARREK